MLFKPGNTLFHRVDPRAKMLMIALVLTLALSTTRIDVLLVLTAIVFISLALFAGITPKDYWKALLLIAPLVVLLTLIQALMQSGEPMFTVGNVRFSEYGILLGLGIGLRLTAMGICFYGFSATTSPSDVALALNKMGVPYKLSYLTSFAFRFLPLVQDEAKTLLTAMAARGSAESSSPNPIRRGKALVRMIFPMLVGALKRSGDISLSMELRGYELKEKRSYFRTIQFGARDAAFTLSVLAVAIALIGMQIYFPESIGI